MSEGISENIISPAEVLRAQLTQELKKGIDQKVKNLWRMALDQATHELYSEVASFKMEQGWTLELLVSLKEDGTKDIQLHIGGLFLTEAYVLKLLRTIRRSDLHLLVTDHLEEREVIALQRAAEQSKALMDIGDAEAFEQEHGYSRAAAEHSLSETRSRITLLRSALGKNL